MPAYCDLNGLHCIHVMHALGNPYVANGRLSILNGDSLTETDRQPFFTTPEGQKPVAGSAHCGRRPVAQQHSLKLPCMSLPHAPTSPSDASATYPLQQIAKLNSRTRPVDLANDALAKRRHCSPVHYFYLVSSAYTRQGQHHLDTD